MVNEPSVFEPLRLYCRCGHVINLVIGIVATNIEQFINFGNERDEVVQRSAYRSK